MQQRTTGQRHGNREGEPVINVEPSRRAATNVSSHLPALQNMLLKAVPQNTWASAICKATFDSPARVWLAVSDDERSALAGQPALSDHVLYGSVYAPQSQSTEQERRMAIRRPGPHLHRWGAFPFSSPGSAWQYIHITVCIVLAAYRTTY
jgi:hypothetical protein